MPAYKFNPLTGQLDGTANTKSDVGLSNVDNTSDANKPVSTATQTALNAKVTGPASATANALVRFDGTTGKLVKNSGVTVDDAGKVFAQSYRTNVNNGAYGYVHLQEGSGTVSGYVGSYAPGGARKSYSSYFNGTDVVAAMTDGATSLLLGTNGVHRLMMDASGLCQVSNSIGFGYGTGSGGTVTQATSKSTTVTLNKPSGQITMHNAALAAGVSAEFTVNNSLVGGKDTVTVAAIWNAVNPSNYRVELTKVGHATFAIRVTNISGASLSDALQIQFNVIKGSTT